LCEKIRSLHQQGIALKEMTAILGMTKGPIYRCFRKMKLAPHPPVKAPPKVAPVQPEFEKIKIPSWMRKGAQKRGLNVVNYLTELAEADVVSSRAETIFAGVEKVKAEEPKLAMPASRPYQMDGTKMQRILFLLAENVPVEAIATRMSISSSTVRRVASLATRRSQRWTETAP